MTVLWLVKGGGGGFLSRSQFGFRQPQGVFHPVTESQKRVDGGPRRAPFEAEQSRNARTREADLECLQLLVIRFHKLWNWKFTFRMHLFFQINTRQLFRSFGYSSVVSSTA